MFERLSRLYEEGHARELSDLLTDANLSDGRATAAAVLIAVTDRPDPGVILTQRPRGMRDHPGQVAFPGGKLDPGEDAVQAALREADEELALAPSAVRLIGASDQYHT
ncbi:MAG: CoA pyrophosphatase, partial [Pseudomonadota bacterium]